EVKKFQTIKIFGQKYSSASTGSTRGSYIQSLFIREQDNRRTVRINNTRIEAWTGQVHFYFRHNQNNAEHYFAYVRWYHTEARQHFEVEGLEEWRRRFMADDYHCILPIHRIYSQAAIVAYGQQSNPDTAKIVVIPADRRIHI
ncbi:hypothetical protein BDA99DRAFT_449457, partial [Phascolomyces articulosus]